MTCLRHKLNDWIYIFLFYFRKWVFIICFNLILFHFFYFVSSFYHFSVAALEMGQTVCGSKLSTLRLLLSAAIQTIYFHFYLIVWIKKKTRKNEQEDNSCKGHPLNYIQIHHVIIILISLLAQSPIWLPQTVDDCCLLCFICLCVTVWERAHSRTWAPHKNIELTIVSGVYLYGHLLLLFEFNWWFCSRSFDLPSAYTINLL